MMVQRIALCVLLAPMAPGTAFSEERRLKGRVVLVGEHDELTPAASVSLKETGDPTRSKASGRFSLFLPEAFKEGERVTLLVDKAGWRIQEIEQSHQDDLGKLGLAAYARKNFAEASRLLSEAAEQKVRKSQHLAQKSLASAQRALELALERCGQCRESSKLSPP